MASVLDKPQRPEIKVHTYQTPTECNGGGDAMYSVGIMNLTRDEALAVGEFARDVRRLMEAQARPSVTKLTIKCPSGRHDMVNARSRCFECEREGIASGRASVPAKSGIWRGDLDQLEEAQRLAAREPEPDEPRNRFSGLDIE